MHVDRGELAPGDAKFRMMKLPDEATLRDLIDQYLLEQGLPVAEEGVVWTLSGGGIAFSGTTENPHLAGPGSTEFARFVYGPHPEHERTIVEVRDGVLATRILDLPVVNDHRVAGFWWSPPA